MLWYFYFALLLNALLNAAGSGIGIAAVTLAVIALLDWLLFA